MIEYFEMWIAYFKHVADNHLFVNVFVLSLAFSGFFYLLFRRAENLKLKINFLAIHTILLFFPFVLSAVLWKCMMPVMSCNPKILIFFGPIGGIFAIILGFMVLPYVYGWSDKNHPIEKGFIRNFVAGQSMKSGIKEPQIYSINDLKPMAYSITNLKPAIFISAGLSELLTKKEMEAILLHEIYHHKSNAYFLKSLSRSFGLFSPLAAFGCVSAAMKGEEIEADNYAISMQSNDKYLFSAKRKMEQFGALTDKFQSAFK